MTDFAALLVPDDGGTAVDLWLVAEPGLDAWLMSRSERVRAFTAVQGFKGRADEVVLLPGDAPGEWAAAAGTGSPAQFALAAAAAKLPAGRYRLRGADGAAQAAGDAGLGWLLAQHRFDRYRKSNGEAGPRVLLTGDPKALTGAVRLAEAVALVRDLVDTPASDMGPGELAAAIAEQARLFGGSVDVTTGEALLDRNFPAVHAVGRAASRAARLVDMRWGNPLHPSVTLVGKGVTFDTGGLNIKPGGGMALMKKDMGGAAHALALARLVMQAGLPVRLRLIVPAVENSISGDAMRPGDVLATRAGKSVEVLNTDAEGRLILADALALAVEEAPGLLIDFATLTGAARVALGPALPALFANEDALAADFLAAGSAAGDPLWRLPLFDGYRDMLKSSIADLNNAPEGGFAGAVTAALFLQAFVPDAIRWAHIDTYAWNPAAKPGRPKGGEALGLRAAWHLLVGLYGQGMVQSMRD